MKTWLIDAGHGGIDHNGHYTTAPNKMYEHDGFTIYEGDINRKIAKHLKRMLDVEKITYRTINMAVEDRALSVRTREANYIHEINGDCVYLSIHSNAGGGKGIETFSYPESVTSGKYSNIFHEHFKKSGKYVMRGAKTANFHVLRETNMPAVLVECLFFDDENEARYLLSEKGQIELATCLFNAICEIEEM